MLFVLLKRYGRPLLVLLAAYLLFKNWKRLRDFLLTATGRGPALLTQGGTASGAAPERPGGGMVQGRSTMREGTAPADGRRGGGDFSGSSSSSSSSRSSTTTTSSSAGSSRTDVAVDDMARRSKGSKDSQWSEARIVHELSERAPLPALALTGTCAPRLHSPSSVVVLVTNGTLLWDDETSPLTEFCEPYPAAIVRALSTTCSLFLLTVCDSDETQENVHRLFSEAGIYEWISEHKCLFCGTRSGKVSIARQLRASALVDSDGELLSRINPAHIPLTIHVSRYKEDAQAGLPTPLASLQEIVAI